MSDSHAIAGRVSAKTWAILEEKRQNSTYSTMSELVGAILETYAKLEEIDPVTMLRARKVEGANDNHQPSEDFARNPMCRLCVHRPKG